MQLFQTGPARYRTARLHSVAYARVNQRHLAFIVGVVALCLPIVLWLGALTGDGCLRDSISHFYYAPVWNGIFVGALMFIGAYLCVYEGEDHAGAEGRLATYAGIAAFVVALMPTSGHGCDAAAFNAQVMIGLERNPVTGSLNLDALDLAESMFSLFPYADLLHYTAAMVLFSFLAWFALFVFTATDPEQLGPDGRPDPAKHLRNRLYYACGAVIVLCICGLGTVQVLMAWTDLGLEWWNHGNWTFWSETLALWAFGLSWMVKGRFLGFALRDAAER